MRLVLAADTHGQSDQVNWPEGDVLIVAGDLTNLGGLGETVRELEALAKAPCPVKIVVPGNHDFLFERQPGLAKLLCEERGILPLVDAGAYLQGRNGLLSTWGSPWTPRFHSWAFMDEPEGLARRWAAVPKGIEVLITHGPPAGVLDTTLEGRSVGDPALLELGHRLQPRLHVFGHVHEAHGSVLKGTTICANVSLVDRQLRLVHEPTVMTMLVSSDRVPVDGGWHLRHVP